jgi:hypothetical protein
VLGDHCSSAARSPGRGRCQQQQFVVALAAARRKAGGLQGELQRNQDSAQEEPSQLQAEGLAFRRAEATAAAAAAAAQVPAAAAAAVASAHGRSSPSVRLRPWRLAPACSPGCAAACPAARLPASLRAASSGGASALAGWLLERRSSHWQQPPDPASAPFASASCPLIQHLWVPTPCPAPAPAPAVPAQHPHRCRPRRSRPPARHHPCPVPRQAADRRCVRGARTLRAPAPAPGLQCGPSACPLSTLSSPCSFAPSLSLPLAGPRPPSSQRVPKSKAQQRAAPLASGCRCARLPSEASRIPPSLNPLLPPPPYAHTH